MVMDTREENFFKLKPSLDAAVSRVKLLSKHFLGESCDLHSKIMSGDSTAVSIFRVQVIGEKLLWRLNTAWELYREVPGDMTAAVADFHNEVIKLEDEHLRPLLFPYEAKPK